MAAPFLPQAQPVYPGNADISKQLALLGDTIGQAYQGYQKKGLLSDVAESLKNQDYNTAAMSLIKGGEMQSGLALLKMQQEQQAAKEFGTGFGGIFGGAPQPSAPPPSVSPQPQTLLPRPPVTNTSRVWGDQEATNAGIYPSKTAGVEVVSPGQFNRMDAMAAAPQAPAVAAPTMADVPQAGANIPSPPPISPQEMQRVGISQGANINGVPISNAIPMLVRAATNPSLGKGAQELARAVLMKSIEQNPEITKLEIFQKRPDLLKTEMDLKRAGATTINTAEGMDAAQAKARISMDQHAVQDLSKKVLAGRAALPILDRMIEINEKTPGGWAGQASPTVAKALASLGLPIPEGVSNAELMVSLSRQFIPSVRDPGATSNYEQSLYSQAVPSLSQSQPGRLQIASMMKAQVQRNADIMAIYRKNVGSPDLDAKLAELDNKPMFTPQQKALLEGEVKRLSAGAAPKSYPNAKQAPDGKFYIPDPARPGKYLMVQ
jgi:hypothetical protein